jgi:hypothetical protein
MPEVFTDHDELSARAGNFSACFLGQQSIRRRADDPDSICPLVLTAVARSSWKEMDRDTPNRDGNPPPQPWNTIMY